MPQKILIIKTGALGDIILSSVFFQTVKKNFPDADIYIITKKIYNDMVGNYPIFKKIICLSNKFILDLIKVYPLKRKKFDIIFDLNGNLRTNFLSFFIGGGKKYGFYRTKLGKKFLTNGINKKDIIEKNPIDRQFLLLNYLNISPENYVKVPKIYLNETDKKKFENFKREVGFDEKYNWIAIHPLSSEKWKTKRWGIDRFAELSDILIENGYKVVIIGDKNGVEYVNQIIKKMKYKPLNLVGKTNFTNLCFLLSNVKILITGDSGPLHIGAALGIRTLGLYGAFLPERHCPNLPNVSYIYKKVACSPCYKKKCDKMLCMKEIKVKDVLEYIFKERKHERDKL